MMLAIFGVRVNGESPAVYAVNIVISHQEGGCEALSRFIISAADARNSKSYAP